MLTIFDTLIVFSLCAGHHGGVGYCTVHTFSSHKTVYLVIIDNILILFLTWRPVPELQCSGCSGLQVTLSAAPGAQLLGDLATVPIHHCTGHLELVAGFPLALLSTSPGYQNNLLGKGTLIVHFYFVCQLF